METLKSETPMEEMPEAEEFEAYAEEDLLEEGEVAPITEEQLLANEARMMDAIVLSKPPIKPTGATQLAHMINVASASDYTSDEVAKSYSIEDSLIPATQADGITYEEGNMKAADEAIVRSPTVPIERRVESLKNLANPEGYKLDPNSPILGTQFAEGIVANESNRYGAGGYAYGGSDSINKLLFAQNEIVPASMTPMDIAQYVRMSTGAESQSNEKASIQEAIEKASTPEEINALIEQSASYTGKEWKFWGSQGAKLFIPFIDQIYLNKVYDVFKDNGIGFAEGDEIAKFGYFLGAGGATQRELTNQLANASPTVRKKVMKGLLELYDGESGSDVYIADLLHRMANGNPHAFMDTLTTALPLAFGPGDLAFAAGLGVKTLKATEKVAKFPLSLVARKPPMPIADTAIRHATQTTGDTAEAAALGNKHAQEFLAMDEGEAAMLVTPGANNFAHESWYGSKAVINETNQKASRHFAEIRQVLGDWGADLVRGTPDEIIGRISSHAKASGVAVLAKGASKLIATDGGFAYEAVYRAADGNGFDTLLEARRAARQFGSKREVVKFAYETADGTVRELSPPPRGMSEPDLVKYRADMKAIRKNPSVKWSIIRKGSVANDTPDEVLFGQFGKEMLETEANMAHRLIDPNSTASKPFHSFLNRVSGEQARMTNLLTTLNTGRLTRLGFKKRNDVNYISTLGGREQKALAQGMKAAEAYENAAVIAGKDPGIPLTELQKIPGWTDKTKDAFIEYVNNAKVTWQVANTNYRRNAIVEGFKQYVHAESGKRVNGKMLSRAEFLKSTSHSNSAKKYAVGVDGHITTINGMAADALFQSDAPQRLIQLHAPFWSGSKYITHQVLDMANTLEEALPPVMLNARTFYYPRVHAGRYVVAGQTELGDWVAIGMAKNAEYAAIGKEAVLKDKRLIEMFPQGFKVKEVSELATREARQEGYDALDGQLTGMVYGARNDELAYWGDEGTDGLVDPIEALMTTVNKLAVGKKDSEISYARLQLTKMGKEEGIIPKEYAGVVVDDFSKFATDPALSARADAYKDAFNNLNAMVQVDNKVQNVWANSLNGVARGIERMSETHNWTRPVAQPTVEGLRQLALSGNNPFTPFRVAYTRLLITGKPLRQGFMQASSALVNLYRPAALAKGWRASSALDSVMSAMDDVVAIGDDASKQVLKIAQEGLAEVLGVSKGEASAIAKHWREMGGYDAINSHLYAQNKYRLLQRTGGSTTFLINKVKQADDLFYGTQGRLGFETGERFAQRVAFLTEVADDIRQGKAALKSKAYAQDAMARAATHTGNMRSEFRISPGGGWLTLAATFITYPVRMAMNTMPKSFMGLPIGGSLRFSRSEKIRLAAAQAALFGTAAWPIAMFADKAFDAAMAELAPPEVLDQYHKLSASLRNGFLGEHTFNRIMEHMTNEEADYDLSSTFGSTTGIDMLFNLMARSTDGNWMDFFLNMTLFKSTRIAEGMTLANMMFNRMFEGHAFEDDGTIEAAMATEFASIAMPQLDSIWLSYIGYSNQGMVAKKGTPTGEAYSHARALLKNGLGIRDASDELAYKTLQKTREALYNTGIKAEKGLAAERADLVYKLIVGQVALKRAGGNSALSLDTEMKNDVFDVMQSLAGYLPKDELLMLQDALIAKHEQMAGREGVDEFAPISLASALYGGTVPNGKAQELYDWLRVKYPQDDWSPELQMHMDKALQHILTVEADNKAGE